MIRRRRFLVKILIFDKMDKKSSMFLKQTEKVLNDNFVEIFSVKIITWA